MIIKVSFDKDGYTGDNIVYLDNDARNFLENMNYHEAVEYFGGELKFQKQLDRDNFLRNYCKENNITLIEIKYNMKKSEIEHLLKQYFIC